MPERSEALRILIIVSVLFLFAGCGGGGGTKPQVDGTAPAAVADLAVSSTSDSSVTLAWTAPGDDGQQGTVKTIDVRHSFAEITDEGWASATAVLGEPQPGIAGTNEVFAVMDLMPDTTYYFALKCADEAANWSGLSNVIGGTTKAKQDETAPGQVTDLSVVSTAASSATLSWTAPGDDGDSGTPASYDIRYSLSQITDGTWSSAIQADGEPVPGAAGSAESFTVVNLISNATYYFGLKAADEVPNTSVLSNITSATTGAGPDTIHPSAVVDLGITQVTSSSITLAWTASGDDGSSGTASSYDVRYGPAAITDANWSSATPADGEPDPAPSGTPESFTVTGLTPNADYCFALRVVDEAVNESGLSNVICDDTNTPPTAVASVDPGSGTLATTFDFDASGSSDAEDLQSSLEFHWDWNGDGVPEIQTTGVTEAQYQFAQIGTRPVILTVVDTRGLSDRDTIQVEVTALPDTTGPATVADLAVSAVMSTSVTLTWTAPGDDGAEGTAGEYDVRHSSGGVAPSLLWGSATHTMNEPDPSVAGSEESFTVIGLDPNTEYTFALKTRDEAGNWSEMSNMTVGTTNTPPVAAFSVNPPSGTTAAAVQFDASASTDGEDVQGNLEFHWDWENDGVFDDQGTGSPIIY